MQETLLGELSAARQVQLHGRIAHALEAQHGVEDRDYVAEIARHYRESAVLNRADAEQAIRLTARAAEYAESAVAWAEASALLQQALALVDAARRTRGRGRRPTCIGGSLAAPTTRARSSVRSRRSMRQTRCFSERGTPSPAAEMTAELARRARLARRGLGSVSDAQHHRAQGDERSRAGGASRPRRAAAPERLGTAPDASVEDEIDAIARFAEAHGLREQKAGVAVARGSVAFARGELAEA